MKSKHLGWESRKMDSVKNADWPDHEGNLTENTLISEGSEGARIKEAAGTNQQTNTFKLTTKNWQEREHIKWTRINKPLGTNNTTVEYIKWEIRRFVNQNEKYIKVKILTTYLYSDIRDPFYISAFSICNAYLSTLSKVMLLSVNPVNCCVKLGFYFPYEKLSCIY